MSSYQIGLFVVPIRFNSGLSIYNDYLNFLCSVEEYGFSHVFIGEHLTDSHEDIQSSMIFASALLARTKSLKVALSVLPLTHYHIPLLVKQLEDLYLLSNERLLVGFSPGALNSDLEYLGIPPETRMTLFCEKLSELLSLMSKSKILSKIPPSSIFSTLLSPLPTSASKLFHQGFSALSSNFTHNSHLANHRKCFQLPPGVLTSSNWNIALNIVDNYDSLSDNSKSIIGQSLEYIYKKLSVNANKIMLGDPLQDYQFVDWSDLISTLIREQLLNSYEVQALSSRLNHSGQGFIVVNLFDCIDDPCYTYNLLKLPSILSA